LFSFSFTFHLFKTFNTGSQGIIYPLIYTQEIANSLQLVSIYLLEETKYLCVAWRQQMARKNLNTINNQKNQYNINNSHSKNSRNDIKYNNNDINNDNNFTEYIQINSELHTSIIVGKILIEKQNHTDVTMTHLMEMCQPFL
jgi:hypothetical protein